MKSANSPIKATLIVGSFAVTIIILLIYALPAPDGRIGISTTRDAPVHVRMANRDLFIPANYFGYPPDTSDDETEILLVALWPNLEPRTDRNRVEFSDVPSHGRRIRILIHDLAKTTDLAFRRQRQFERSAPLTQHEAATDGRFGLRFRKTADLKANSIYAAEYYESANDKNGETLIQCRMDEITPNPGCDQLFEYQGLLVKLGYSKSYLSEWRSFEEEVKQLLSNFSTNGERSN